MDGLTLASVTQVYNCLVAVGYLYDAEAEPEPAGFTVAIQSEDSGATWTEPVKIAQSDEEQADVVILYTGEILAVLTYEGQARTYVSRDYGATWSEVGGA